MISSPKRKSSAISDLRREGDALYLYSQRGSLRLSPKSDSILRVTYTEEDCFSEGESLGICCRERYSQWTYCSDHQYVTLELPKMKAVVTRSTGSIAWYDGDGELLFRERERDSHQLYHFDAYRTVVDENTVVKQVETPDGVKSRIEEATTVFDRRLCHTRLNLRFSEEEHLYGLGQSPEGCLDLRHTTQYIHQSNMKIAIPFLLSSRGYGILLGTEGAAKFCEGNHGAYLYTDADRELDFYVLYGPEMDDLVSGYRFLTGKAALPPKWAFGFLQSQERYESAEELLSIADGFRSRNLGLDCLVLDWNSWLPGHWGEKKLDPAFFPDVPGMVRALEDRDVHFMLSIWPNPGVVTEDYAQFFEKNLLLPASDLYNAFNADARKLYWEQTRRGLFSQGIKAFWCDSCEPFCPEWTEEEPEPGALFDSYIQESSRFIPRDRINAYALEHARTIYEGMRGETDAYRVCNLTRSAYTGSQRYGTILWSGDISANWETLGRQIPAGLNFCASGIPFWTLDIGGFFVKKGTQWFWNGDFDDPDHDPGFRELLVRWFQLGAFLPVFRSHGTDVLREPWHFGEEGTPFYDAIRAAIDLRYRLMPYIYSMAAEAALRNGTMMRMLAFDYRHDPVALTIEDEYLFGKSILVCPVTHPILYAPGGERIAEPNRTRRVYLPEGNDWFDFYTRERFRGGQWLEVPVVLERIPLFVKAGSIIPMTETVHSTAQSAAMPIEYRVFPGGDGEFTLYEDAGDGYGYEAGEYTLTHVRWCEAEQKLFVES